jgi:hypothetical protein
MMTLENRYNLSIFSAPYDSRDGFSGHSYSGWAEGTDYLFHRGEMEYQVRYADSANSSRKFVHCAGNALTGRYFDTAARNFQAVSWNDVPFDVQECVNGIIKYEIDNAESVARTLAFLEKQGCTAPAYWTVRGNQWEICLEHEDAKTWRFVEEDLAALRHGVFTDRTSLFAEAIGAKKPAIEFRERVSNGSPVDFAINYIAKEKGLEVKGIEKVKSFRFYLVNTNDGQYMAEFRETDKDEFRLRMEPVMTADAAARKECSKLQKAWDSQITRVSVLAGIPWKVSAKLAKAGVQSEAQAIEWGKRIRAIAGTADAVDLHDLRKGGLVRKCNAISHMMNVKGLFVERLSAGEIGVLARYIAG